jgi:hypothetical protein
MGYTGDKMGKTYIYMYISFLGVKSGLKDGYNHDNNPREVEYNPDHYVYAST